MLLEVEIFFKDLTEEAQKRLLEAFETTEEDENWGVFTIAVVCREKGFFPNNT